MLRGRKCSGIGQLLLPVITIECSVSGMIRIIIAEIQMLHGLPMIDTKLR